MSPTLATMTNPDYREPSNDELWAQPPVAAQPSPVQPGPVHHGLAPLQPVAMPAPHQAAPPIAHQPADRTVFALALVSIALGIPLTAISSSTAGLPGLLVVWVGIVLVNVVYSRSRRH